MLYVCFIWSKEEIREPTRTSPNCSSQAYILKMWLQPSRWPMPVTPAQGRESKAGKPRIQGQPEFKTESQQQQKKQNKYTILPSAHKPFWACCKFCLQRVRGKAHYLSWGVGVGSHEEESTISLVLSTDSCAEIGRLTGHPRKGRAVACALVLALPPLCPRGSFL